MTLAFLLAIALGAAVFSERFGKVATLAKESNITKSHNLSSRKTAAVCSLNTNLIINSGAEADTAAIGDGFADLDVSAWENETGEFTVAKYDAPSGFPTSTDPGPANRGTFLFVAGYTDTSSGSQVIDLSGCSGQIDSGTQQFNLSGFLGGFLFQNDSPRVALTFKDAGNVPIGTASIGPVTGTERNNVTGLIERKSIGMVPVGTRSVEVLLQMTRLQGVYNDSYADNLSFILATPQACSSLPSGAVGWWKAEGNANDVLEANNGVIHNGATFSTGLVGQAFSFDGTDDYVSVNRSIQDNFTIEFWLNTTQVVGTDSGQWYEGRGLVDAEVRTVTNDFGVTLRNGKVLFGVGNPDVTIRSGVVADGNWHHVAATRLRSTGEMRLYLDGLQVASATGGTQSLTAPPRITFGRVQVDNNPFQGKLDEVSIYDRALSPTEIQAIFNAGSSGKCGPGSIQSLTLTPNPVNGGQSATGTVTLAAAAPAGGVVVNLMSGNLDVATVPSSLTIAEGQTTGTFPVTTFVPTSDASALITASYQTSSTSASLTVLAPKPDLTVSAASVPTTTQTDSAFNISWTIKNQGPAQAYAPWIDRVWLSNDNQIGPNDTLIGEFPFNSNLESNQTADRIQTLSIARSAITQDGPYFLLVQTDANNQINEGANENNNFVARPINITRPPRPDLVVESIVAPNTAFFGQTILVQWTVKNIGSGPTNAQGWQDFVYLSLDSAPEIEDPFKIPVTNVSYLSAGESYTATAEVKIPQGLVGQYKIIVWTDGDGTNHRSNSYPHQVIENDDENNYGIARPIQINTPTLPDLQTVSVVAPEEVFAGGQMTLNWRVENHGDGVTPPDQTNWLDKVYLSQDTTLDVSTDRLIGSRPRNGALIQNEGYTVSNFNIPLPNDIAGDWFVFIAADGDNQVYEFSNETNNANYDRQQPGSPMHIRATPPDLVIPTSLTAPATVSTGQSLNISWTVKNQGAFEAAPNWFDAVYLSADQTLNTESDTLLTSVFRSSSLGPGLTYDVTANVTVPSCIVGTYYLFVMADNRQQIFEFDPNLNAEANNSSQPRSIQIVDATPDLRVTSVGHPATGNAGQQISMNWTVSNQGAGATAPTKWTDRIYLSPNQTFESSTALLIGYFDHVGALNNGENYTRTENLTIPNAAQGSYFMIVVTDANNEIEECANNANNIGIGSQSIAISNALPDLVVQSANSQSNPVGGQTISVNWTIANQGMVAVNNPSWGDAVYFSTDAVLGNDDLRLATAPAAAPLAVGEIYNRQVQATLPVVPPGNYFLLIQADYLSNVFEGQHEDNNLRNVALAIQVPAVDLTVTAVDAPATQFSGQDMTVSWTVLNNGSNPTLGARWVDEVVLSLDQIDDPSDRVIGSKQHDGVLHGQNSYNGSLSVFVPQGFTGQYYVFVRTDRRNEVAESNENNNSTLDATVFNLTPPADLVVSSIAPPSSSSPGEQITVNWTIQNGGANPATGLWNDAVYLSSDQTWDIGDVLLGKQAQVGPIAAGQSYNGQLTTILPAINLGDYYVIVRSDVQNRVRETNDDDNTGVATAQTSIDVTALQIGVPRNTTLLTGQERFYKTDAPANETVRLTLNGQTGSANELFARFDQIATRTSFDFSFSRLNEANQEVIVPNSQAGNYFTLARSEFSTPSPQSVTIKAEVIPFGITSVSPNHVGDNGQVTITLKGARFEEGATVQLSGNGTTLNPAKIIRVDSSTVKARFMFTNAPHGLYDIILNNPGGQTSTQSGAVTIEQTRSANPMITNHGSLRTRTGRSLGIYSEASNPGNVDIQYVIIKTEILLRNSQDRITIITQRPNESLPRKTDFPEVDWNNNPATNARRGESTSETFIYRDLPPGQNISFDTEVRGLINGTPYVRVQAHGQTRSEFIEGIREAAEAQRQLLLETNTPIKDPVVQAAVSERQKWWDFYQLIVRDLGYAEGVLEDVLTARRSALGSLLGQIKTDIIANVVSSGCQLLVDTITNDCSIRCPFRAGCCAVGAGASLFATFEIPLLAVANGINAGANIGGCFNDGLNCGKSGSCRYDPDEGHGCSWLALVFLEPGDFSRACLDKAIDPNEKLSPDGYGAQRFVPIQQEIPYTINFENISTATAYAQRVRITDQLDPNLDPRTLRLREIGFKQYRFRVPDNRAFFQQRVQLGPDLGNLLADISAGVDLSTGTVTWTLTAIDPATGEQPNGASLGLLPPNNDSNDGQGFVTFTIKPKSTVVTGAVIHNEATITFDTEALINTNVVSNTIDAEAPGSAVNSLPTTQLAPTFNISWSGQDAPNGSGLLNYDVFFSANNGPSQSLLSGTTATSTQFTGEPNTTYRFYSIARDNAGNVELPPATPDAVTTIGAEPNPVPMLTGLSPNSTAAGSPQFTLNVSGNSFISDSVVQWNGTPRTTTFVSATELSAIITADDIAVESAASVTVVNPAPGGGSSNSLIFSINSSPPVTPPVCPTNVAAASYGATASASSEIGANYSASGVIDGNHIGSNWGSGTGWNDATAGQYPDHIEVNLGITQQLSEIDIYSMQDNYTNPVEPYDSMTFMQYGLVDFQVQVPDGSGGWTNVEGGLVSNNNLVKRRFVFTTPVSTDRIRVVVNNSADGVYSRIIEVEAYSCNAQPVPMPTPSPTPEVCVTNVALASYGATVTASSEAGAGYAASGVINGDRAGNNWGSGGGWNDQTATTFPDDLVVNLGVTQSINEIDVYTLQDNYQRPLEPTDSMTFSAYGMTQFHLQVPNDSGGWMDVAFVTNNNHVKRRFVFSTPISTDRIRVLVDNSADSVYSRVTEVEALSCNPVPVPTPSPTPTPTSCMTNVAAASYGATASASSEISPNYAASGAIDGNHTGAGWGTGVGWNDATAGEYPDSLEVNLGVIQQLSEIDVYSLQDNYQSPIEPTDAMTFNYYGLTDFQVQVPDGVGGWMDVPGGHVTNNNLVKRRVVLTRPIVTSRIRVLVNNSADAVYSRIIEVEALSCSAAPQPMPTPQVSNGKIAFQTYRGDNSEIYLINADGTGEQRVAMNLAVDILPSWGGIITVQGTSATAHPSREVYINVGCVRDCLNTPVRNKYALSQNEEKHDWSYVNDLPRSASDFFLKLASSSAGLAKVATRAGHWHSLKFSLTRLKAPT